MAERAREAKERDRIREFYASRRNTHWSGAAYLVEERQQLLRRAVVDFAGIGLDTARVLDVGCGTGGDLAFWGEHGVDEERLFGTEILPERAAAAVQRLPNATIVPVDGFKLPFESAAFQLVSASMVLSSITDDDARALLFSEMVRVTAFGGVVAVYDFRVRKPSNRSVVALSRSRASALGGPPDEVWSAGPFLPLLPATLKLPSALRRGVIRVLPRTHVLYLWKR